MMDRKPGTVQRLRVAIPLLATREQIKAAIAEKEAGPPPF
jgi:hypothetical protein